MIPTCDICGEPAFYGERDIRETNKNPEWRTFEPVGSWRFGCFKHPPKLGRILWLNPDRDYRLSADEIAELSK